MFNQFGGSLRCVANQAHSRGLGLAIFGLLISLTGCDKALALPVGEDAGYQIYVSDTKEPGAERARIFALCNKPVADGFGDFVEFFPLISPEGQLVPKVQAEQKVDNSDGGSEGDADAVEIHVAILIWVMCLVAGVAIGGGFGR
jgi:hypothetical protein